MYRDSVGHRLKMINNLMKRNVDKVIGHKPDKATLMHSWIMGFLQRREEKKLDTFQKDIEKEFSMNRSTTSEMLKLMDKNGLIQRIPVNYDARLKKIVLTDLGRECNRKTEEQILKVHNRLVEGLSDEEVQTLLSLCDKMIADFKKYYNQGNLIFIPLYSLFTNSSVT